MNPRNIVAAITIIITTLSHTVKAQEDYYMLSSYRMPVLKRDQLSLSIGGSQTLLTSAGLNYSIYSASQLAYWHSTKYSTTNNTNEYGWHSLYPQLSYYQIRNRPNFKGQNYLRLRIIPTGSKNETLHQYREAKNILYQPTASGFNRFYFNNKLHMGLEHNLSYSFSQSKDSLYLYYNETTSISNIKESQLSLSVPILIGYGRLEEISDLRLAIYILEDLIAAGKMAQIPPVETIHRFADAISVVKNRRHFDDRKRRMEELAAIDEFLSSEQLLSTEADIEYAAILNDLMGFGLVPARKTGLIINAGFFNSLELNNHKSSPDVSSKERIVQYGLMTNIVKARPINLYWQSDTEIGLRLLREIDKFRGENTIISTIDFDHLLIQGVAAWTIRFLPDTRSSLGLTVAGGYTNRRDWKSDGNGLDDNSLPSAFYPGGDRRHHLHLTTESKGYYYFSPKLRGEYRVGYSYINTLSSKFETESNSEEMRLYHKTAGWQFNIGIRYALF